ncbi:MAG TPA: DNA polymerase I [Rubricoccaceae bacterium]|nr:DNA polymerase I [Rubricoccaceae bacterium]
MPDQPDLFENPLATPPDGAPEQAADGDPEETAEAATDQPPEARKERLYLVDAMALAYRAHFAFISRPLINSKGLNTSAAYGFVVALLKLLEDEKPEHIAVVFDAVGPGGTFRDALYADYKANRAPMPDGLRECLPHLPHIVEAFDIPCLTIPGVEADDVIGTLAKRAESENVDVVIVSPDKDFRQLLSSCVSIFKPAYKGEAFDRETADTFRKKYGLEPEQFIDVLALLGDASDNVPGVPGIGEKTAPELVKQYGSVENLLAHAEEVKAKRVREGLIEHRDDALLSKRLVTIDTAVPLDVDWHRLRRTPPDVEALHALFNELEFGGRLRSRIEAYAAGEPRRPKGFTTLPEDDPSLAFDFGPYAPVETLAEADVEYTIARGKTDLPAAAAHAEGKPVYSFDTETTSVDPMHASLVGISLASEEKKAVYVPTPMPDGTTDQAVLDALRPALEDPAALKIGHNVKYDLVVLGRHGVEVAGPFFDTMVAHYLIQPEASHKLDDVSSFFLNYRPKPISDLIGTGKNALSMRDVPLDEVGPYAAEDADVALRLWPVLKAKLEEDRLLQIAEEIEFPLVPVLADMERAGVKVDPAVLAQIGVELEAEMRRLEGEIYKAAGRAFGIGSPKQIAEVLFNPPPTDEDRAAAARWAEEVKDPKAAGKTKKRLEEERPTFGLGLLPLEKTGSGTASTNERVLEQLATEHPLPGFVLDWRKLAKLKGTYIDALPAQIHPETGRIHTDFNQTIAATGRLSSNNPNLQNIPIRTDLGREIRRAFVAEPGCVLLSADYAQIELRIIAHMSGDRGLIEAFQSGLDIHTATASRVFGVDLEKVTRAMRNQVKQVNYGIPYGISAFGLAQRLRIGNKEAQQLIDQYRASYPDVGRFLDTIIEEAREKGYVETLLGRRRYVPLLGSRNPAERATAERIAVNMPVQGTQADMIKRAMVAVHRRIREEGLKARMILQVHDELVFEVPEGEVDVLTPLVVEEMKGALPLTVPIEVEVGTGPNWLDAH